MIPVHGGLFAQFNKVLERTMMLHVLPIRLLLFFAGYDVDTGDKTTCNFFLG
jgi:hypothetical protein